MSDNPFYKMIDRQALARQQQTGESYAVAFTKCYEDPTNKVIVDNLKYEDQARSHDAIFGSRFSAIPAAKTAPYDPLQKSAEIAEQFGPAHAKLHSMAVDHQRAHSGMSYEQAYSHLYSRMENAPLRDAIKAEHMRASMAGLGDGELGKAAAPMDAVQDYVSPGAATAELERLVVTRMKNNPKLSYQQSFTQEYLAPANRSLKDRYDQEGILRAQAREPAKPFPAYARG
jgi:hypothetical protein